MKGTLVLIYFVVIVAGLIGWCMNFYKFCHLDFDKPYAAEVVRGVGLIPGNPIGAIAGYMTFEEEKKK